MGQLIIYLEIFYKVSITFIIEYEIPVFIIVYKIIFKIGVIRFIELKI